VVRTFTKLENGFILMQWQIHQVDNSTSSNHWKGTEVQFHKSQGQGQDICGRCQDLTRMPSANVLVRLKERIRQCF